MDTKIIIYQETTGDHKGDWVAYITNSDVVAIGLGATREDALSDLVLILARKLNNISGCL